ncbi:MAG: hypothetical protein JNM55_14375 [Anaerolineales bacterium]|nr:hypothetical protein [Anaerolineales bacterium]
MNHPRRTSKTSVLIFGLLTLIAYGLLVPFTGFYWDDWPFAWIAKFLGPAEFIPAFMPFRPFLGPIFYVTTSLIPPYPIYWQVFAVVIRFVMGLSLWWSLGKLWPEKKRLNFIATLLFIVFPGYSQHWVALTHINQELIPFIFYILSFGFTFKALRAEKPLPYTIIAILLQICGIYPTEYFFPLESLRFLLLFFFYFEGTLISRFFSTIRAWWAYLLVWISNALWLVYYYKFGPYNSYEVTAVEATNYTGILLEILDTIWKACFYIWVQIFTLLAKTITAPTSLLTIALIVVSFVILTRVGPFLQGESENKTFSIFLIITGFISILLGRIPSLAAELPLRLQTGYDRFMVSMMIGCIFFAIGAIELSIRNDKIRSTIYILLVALGIGQQFYTANVFRRDWEKQKEFYWQLTSRIPALKPNTTLLTYQLPTEYEPDLSYTGPINWMYAPNFTPPNLPYALIFTEKRIGGSTLPSLAPDSPIKFNYRTAIFNGSTSQAVVIYMPVNGCVRVLDPSRGDVDIYSKQPDELTQAISLSNPSLITPDPETPASPFFLDEKDPVNWCAYFTKAELAHQLKEYEKTVNLLNEAMAIGYKPEDLNEWLIYIDSLARTGEVESANEKSLELLSQDSRMKRGVCVVWNQLKAQGIESAVQAQESFGCNQ